MTELSSQAYDQIAGCAGPRVFRFPPWCAPRVVSAETGQPVECGQTGLLQAFDLANVASVLAIQTADLVIAREPAGFEFVGRAVAAEARGCSLQQA
jgi:hypothetical protein